MQRVLISALIALPLSFACESEHANSSVASREMPPSPTPRFIAPDFASSTSTVAQPVPAAPATLPSPTSVPTSNAAPPPQTSAPSDASVAKPADVSLFYDSLAPYGEWTELAPYGWVWIPREVPVGWKPYTTGHWAYADEAGWLWVGDEPWAWAPYHYGRWTCDESLGWAWVPGNVWGPAWVAWRTGPQYCGWAPLPPAATFEAGVGFINHGVDIDQCVGTFGWCFVATADVCAPHVHEVLVVPARNVTILHQTTIVNNITVVDGRVLNRGVGVVEVEQRSGGHIERVMIRDAERVAPNGTLAATAPGANEVAMYRRTLQPAPVGARPKALAAEAAMNVKDDAQYAAFRQRENAQLLLLYADEDARLQELHESEVGRATDENAIRALRQQHAAEIQAMQQNHLRERNLLEQRQARLRRRAGGV